MTKRKKYYLLGLLVVIFFLKDNVVLAQENKSGFSITPFFQEVSLEKDQKESKFLVTVENTTGAPAIFRLSVLDFGALDESGGVAFAGTTDLEKKYGLASWVSLEKDAIVLNPQEKQDVKVTIENKESLSPGGHYGAVFLKMESDDKVVGGESSSVAFKPSLTSLIFVRKLGGETYGVDLKSQEMSRNLWQVPEKINLRFQNTGNVHATPRGIVRISDPLGREVLRGIINQESAIILPETFRIIQVSFKKTAPLFLPGRYAVSIEYRYDGKDDFVAKNFSVNILPGIDMIGLLIVVALIIGYIKFRNKKVKQAK